MDLTPFQSGVGNLWADARAFLAGVKFARPDLLWLSLAPILVAVLGFVAARRKRKLLAAFGRPAAVAGLHTERPTKQRLARFLLGLGWTALVLAVAGPRWGKAPDDGTAVGRDVVVVIDLSRSMLAEDLSTPDPRWKAAVDGAVRLVDACRGRGGHRVGVVVFAARPHLFVPLTTDYDHLKFRLRELDGSFPPHEVRPITDSVLSGTRIGAALKLAVDAHDGRFGGSQDIILFTDADDPEADDEWRGGVNAARTSNIPVHVVGVGNPASEFPLTLNRPGRGEELIPTRLHEQLAKDIAADGKGEYLAARRDPPDTERFFHQHIAAKPPRQLDDDPTTALRDRSGWFYAAAALLLLAGWVRER